GLCSQRIQAMSLYRRDYGPHRTPRGDQAEPATRGCTTFRKLEYPVRDRVTQAKVIEQPAVKSSLPQRILNAHHPAGHEFNSAAPAAPNLWPHRFTRSGLIRTSGFRSRLSCIAL